MDYTSPSVGTLNDKQIIEMCRKQILIEKGFSEENVKQACYELRAGLVYYDLTVGSDPIPVKDGESVLIKPRHLVVLITRESLLLPSDILGRILSKGSLFSLGLTPVNTYADPGFSGNLGIVFFNVSSKYVRIPVGMSIAKIEFSRLSKAVERPYDGQHGYQSSIWPIRTDLLMSDSQATKDHRVGTPIEELTLQYGEHFGALVKRVFVYERRLIYLTMAILLTNFIVLLFLQSATCRDNVLVIGLGIVSNVFAILITLLVTNLGWIKWKYWN